MTLPFPYARRSFSFSPSLLHLYFINFNFSSLVSFRSSLVPFLRSCSASPRVIFWALDLILSGLFYRPGSFTLSFPRDSSSLRFLFPLPLPRVLLVFSFSGLSLAQLPTWSLLLFIRFLSFILHAWFLYSCLDPVYLFSPPRLSLVICIFASVHLFPSLPLLSILSLLFSCWSGCCHGCWRAVLSLLLVVCADK